MSSYYDREEWYRTAAGRPARPNADRPIPQASTQDQLDWHIRRAAELEMKLVAIAKFGKDDWEDETVFRFDKQFRGSGVTYSYAMIKANGLWYSTGPKAPKGFTWSQMVDWWLQGIPVTDIWVVSAYKNLSEF